MQHEMGQASQFLDCLTFGQSSTAIINFRCIHDKLKDIPAHTFRGTLAQHWQTLCSYNVAGYGIFAVIAEMDGQGNSLPHVGAIRAHYVDLDNELTAPISLGRARDWFPSPCFGVRTSFNKYHVYWPVAHYKDNDRFQIVQRKLFQFFDGDKSVIDATRVMRLPGTYHCKDKPQLVTFFAMPGYGYFNSVETLEQALAHINVFDTSGGRYDLGHADLAAPSLDWIKFALSLIDPNSLDRGEWISLTAAIKQAGWTCADEKTLFDTWSEWCARYDKNDVGENVKQWNSIRQTEIGWKTIVARAPGLRAQIEFGNRQFAAPGAQSVGAAAVSEVPPMPTPPALDCSGEMLTHVEQKQFFKGCVYVERIGKILTPSGRYMDATKFNGAYGGKIFIIDSNGKVTDEPWKAALRSTMHQIEKVDHVRFLPESKPGEIITDQMGRTGVNTYIPIRPNAQRGDVSPFLKHVENLLPDVRDREIFYRYLAHNVKFPGFKIPWAPMLQSTEGAGKTFFQMLMEHALGKMYVHTPKAEELIKSGSTFNAWMRAKLMIIVNEIKVDERRELIEILKPMITDAWVEVQSKGIDQDMEDNCANWLFFSNYKDAIPINKSSRRYAIFYSAIQSQNDLQLRGMDMNYFNNLFNWLRADGAKFITQWLLDYKIERGEIDMRAPDTSSKREAEIISRGPLESLIADAIEDGLPGFRGGFVSVEAVTRLQRSRGGRVASGAAIRAVCEGLGYRFAGRSVKSYFQEDVNSKSSLYFAGEGVIDLAAFGKLQGYE